MERLFGTPVRTLYPRGDVRNLFVRNDPKHPAPTDEELAGLDLSEILFEDDRQKIGKHENIEEYVAANSIQKVRARLTIGDYATDYVMRVVDTKYSIDELCKDMTQDYGRTHQMLDRVRSLQYAIYFLIESVDTEGVANRTDLSHWKNPVCFGNKTRHACQYKEAGLCDPDNAMKCKKYTHLRYTPSKADKILRRMHICERDYAAFFLFCTHEETPQLIHSLLWPTPDGVKFVREVMNRSKR